MYECAIKMLVMNWIWKENPKHKFSKIHLKRTWKCWEIGRAWYHYDWKLCSELFLAQILAVGDMLLFVVLELSDIGQCPGQRCKRDFFKSFNFFVYKLRCCNIQNIALPMKTAGIWTGRFSLLYDIFISLKSTYI